MSEPRIVLFADGGPNIGAGHIFRQYPIFRCLLAMGISAEMWVPLEQESLNELGVKDVRSIPIEPSAIALALNAFAPAVVVLDTYRHLSELIELLEVNDRSLVVFDDHFRVKRKVALIVNSSPAADAGNYDLGLASQVLTGPDYASVSNGFLDARLLYRVAPKISRILVALGGADFCQNLPNLLRVVIPLLQTQTQIFVVGGRPASIDVPRNIELTWGWLDQDILARRMADIDLAILAGGTMLWQAACVGVPTLSWPQTPGQMVHAASWKAKGAIIAVKDLNTIPSALEQLQSLPLREELSAAGRKAIDGLGATRIAVHLSELLTT